jgi:hypothetical protein
MRFPPRESSTLLIPEHLHPGLGPRLAGDSLRCSLLYLLGCQGWSLHRSLHERSSCTIGPAVPSWNHPLGATAKLSRFCQRHAPCPMVVPKQRALQMGRFLVCTSPIPRHPDPNHVMELVTALNFKLVFGVARIDLSESVHSPFENSSLRRHMDPFASAAMAR